MRAVHPIHTLRHVRELPRAFHVVYLGTKIRIYIYIYLYLYPVRDRLDTSQDLYYIPSNVQRGNRYSYITCTGSTEFTNALARIYTSAAVVLSSNDRRFPLSPRSRDSSALAGSTFRVVSLFFRKRSIIVRREISMKRISIVSRAAYK